MRSPDELKRLAEVEGIVAATATLELSDYKDEALIGAIAAGGSRRNILISDRDLEILGSVSGTRFFGVQTILCEVIPRLDASSDDIIRLVSTLVEKGGDDMAANRPNAAFRQWCETDLERADAVIAAARGGDDEAMRHVVFALEAKGDAEEAFRCTQADGPQRTAGILALSRVSLDSDEAQRAVALIAKMATTATPAEAAGMLHAAYDVAAKHNDLDRTELVDALRARSDKAAPEVVHLMATALYRHAAKMTPEEFDLCATGLLAIDPTNIGTVNEIDGALREIWKTRPGDATRLAASLIERTEGRISQDDLDRFYHAVGNGDPQAMARLATSWLLNANIHVCATLHSLLSEINRTEPHFAVDPVDLPETAEEQVFLCRKAIGYLILSPMTAAAWIVAVLRGGHPDAKAQAADLLFEPLLVNFGGALKDWLERIVNHDAPGRSAIQHALDRARELQNGIEAAGEVVELEPSTHRRAQVQFMEAEEQEQVRERAQAMSIFAGMVTTQNLLYGDRSSFRVSDKDGRRHSQTTHMASMTVQTELPKGLIFDPIGFERMLDVLRREVRTKS
mgnify:CR=1 FL=1